MSNVINQVKIDKSNYFNCTPLSCRMMSKSSCIARQKSDDIEYVFCHDCELGKQIKCSEGIKKRVCIHCGSENVITSKRQCQTIIMCFDCKAKYGAGMINRIKKIEIMECIECGKDKEKDIFRKGMCIKCYRKMLRNKKKHINFK
jgi:hypothetical protein